MAHTHLRLPLLELHSGAEAGAHKEEDHPGGNGDDRDLMKKAADDRHVCEMGDACASGSVVLMCAREDGYACGAFLTNVLAKAHRRV